ncbi:MAG: hypothetical protein IPK19_25275 [Chloroflexi bacterium]|nr:hypothetical protein [Chloroflexota bacterium]
MTSLVTRSQQADIDMCADGRLRGRGFNVDASFVAGFNATGAIAAGNQRQRHLQL